MKPEAFALLALLVTACGDRGHVVGDNMGSGSATSADGRSASTVSTTGSTASGGASTSAATGATGATGVTTTSTGTGTGGGSGGSTAAAGGATTTTSGAGGASGSGGSAGECGPGEMWCPGCLPGEGSCGVACTGSVCQPCEQIGNEEECDARIDCHSVFQDPGTCGCASVGCCARFASCAPEGVADCTGANLSCASETPHCENPAFVVSYSGTCHEGCVKPEWCAGNTTGTGGTGGGSCDPACTPTLDDADCADGEVAWYCGPIPDNVDDLDESCTSLQGPQPVWCCPPSVRSECVGG